MKNLYAALLLLLSSSVFGQIQHDINKNGGVTESNPINDIDSIRFNPGQTEMEIILNNGNVENHTISDIDNVTFSGQYGEVTLLDCAGATINGSIVEGVAANNVTADISYTGGNGGPHNGQTVTSTGITGLTATLGAGNFANGAGTLTYNITGTPNTSGTASFAIQIGGQTCTLEITVDPGSVSTLDCAGATINGALVDGVAANNVSADISYAGGNGGPHNGQTVSSTGVTGLTATLGAGNFANGAGTLTYNITGTPNTSGTASFTIDTGGQTCILEITVDPGSVSALDCAGATINGTLVDGVVANSVSADIDYTGGNGGTHNGQTVASTGATGLTATLAAGNFANGTSTLTYSITGTPNSNGTASFAIQIGGQTCTLAITVEPGAVSTLDCAGATINGTLVDGVAASGVSADINYTGGNGGPHNGQTVSSTGVTGLTATLAAGNFSNGAGTLNYSITGTPSSNGTASFAIDIGGQTCILEITVDPGSVSTLDCAGATINGTLVDGVAANNVSANLNYTGGNGGSHNGQTVTSTGVTGLTATLAAGNFANGAGTLIYDIIGTPGSSGTASFAIDIGGQTCVLEITVDPGSVSTLDCAGANRNGSLEKNVAANGVTISINYTGGNGGSHIGQIVTSTGVTGLTATLPAGNFANGSGTLTYTISGTANSGGTAMFMLNIGGQSCTIEFLVTPIYCSGASTAVIDVFNPVTGETWMDRNLGASQAAANSTDANSFGDLYQWGRNTDGHQCRTSSATAPYSYRSSTDQPPHGDFIYWNAGNYDWRDPQNDNLWQGVNGINNPCPNGYRLPTLAELDAERLSWSSNDQIGALNSPLKLPFASFRIPDGSFFSNQARYWSSTVAGISSHFLLFENSLADTGSSSGRAMGLSVRCIKD